MAANAHAKCVGREMRGFSGSASARRAKFAHASEKCAKEHGRTRSGKRRSRKGGR
jgi:hypothetical protein